MWMPPRKAKRRVKAGDGSQTVGEAGTPTQSEKTIGSRRKLDILFESEPPSKRTRGLVRRRQGSHCLPRQPGQEPLRCLGTLRGKAALDRAGRRARGGLSERSAHGRDYPLRRCRGGAAADRRAALIGRFFPRRLREALFSVRSHRRATPDFPPTVSRHGLTASCP